MSPFGSGTASGGGGWNSDVNSALAKFYGPGGENAARENAWSAGNAKGYGEFQDRERETFLEKTFGKKEEFEAYHELFAGLTGAIGAAYTAWVDGSMSAGEAAKQFLKQSLAALGQRMLIRGLEEFAEGVAAVAVGSPSAVGHFASAALFTSGAAAAGLASSSISGSTSGGGGKAPNVSGSGGSGGDGGQRQAVIVVGDSFADDSPRRRQIRAQELVARALGSTSGGRSE